MVAHKNLILVTLVRIQLGQLKQYKQKEIITDDDLTEDMKNAEVKRYREDIKRDGIIIEIDIPIMVC